MTLDQIEHVLRELGWRGQAGSRPEVFLNNTVTWGRMWIENGLVVMDGPLGKRWMDPSAITAITPFSFGGERPASRRSISALVYGLPFLRVGLPAILSKSYFDEMRSKIPSLGRIAMLDRPPGRRDRRRAAARQARWRRRARNGTMPVTVEVDARIIGLLVETKWMSEQESADRAKIAAAIERMLADAARN